MNLSVVMGVVDKMKAPLQTLTQSTNRFTKEMEALQAKQADTSAQMAMISGFKQTESLMQKNATAISVAAEKLAELEAKAAKAEKPSAKLNAQIDKQRAALNLLNDDQAHYQAALDKASNAMKKAGINTGKLDDEFDRLNGSYAKQVEQLSKVGASYDKLQRRLKPLQSMSDKIRLPTMEGVQNTASAAMAPLAGVGLLGLVINDTASEINSLAKAASEVKMPIEMMQAMRLQATNAGAEAEDMDSAIREMALRWGEMKTLKSGAMHDYFKDTKNPAAFKALMSAKDEAEAYKILINEIAKEADVSKRNFMMDEFFGGDSEKLIAVLSAGTKGLEAAKDKLDSVGGIVDDDAVKNAKAYSNGLKELGLIINTMKVSVFVPIMGRLAETFKGFAQSMQNADYREDVINQVGQGLVTLYNVFSSIGKAVLFVSEHWKGLIASLALVKIAVLALNAAMIANPVGLMVAGIAALTVGITYITSKFVTFTEVVDFVKSAFDGLMYGIKKIISFIPDALVPDSWKASIEGIRKEVEAMDNASINLNHSTNANGFKPISSMGAYQPLGNNSTLSKSQVDVTIKSESPLLIDSLKADKQTELNVSTGNMLMLY